MCLFALGHLMGFFQAAHAARHDPRLAELTRAMREHRANVLGFRPSILDFREYFSPDFSLLLLLAAPAGFVALSGAISGPALQQMAWIYALTMVLLMGSSLYYSVIHGVIACAVIGALFGLSWWFARAT